MGRTRQVDQDVIREQRYPVVTCQWNYMYLIILPDKLTQRLYEERKQEGTDGAPLAIRRTLKGIHLFLLSLSVSYKAPRLSV